MTCSELENHATIRWSCGFESRRVTSLPRIFTTSPALIHWRCRSWAALDKDNSIVDRNCRRCLNAPATHIWYCDDCYKCDDCETTEQLVIGPHEIVCYSCEERRTQKAIAEFDGETSYTHEIVCPHCGYEYSDSWDYGEGERNCNRCNLKFDISQYVEVTYSTTKVKP